MEVSLYILCLCACV